LRTTARKRQSEAGQAVFFLILGLTFFLLAAVGIGIDGSHLYAQRQMAQAAADSAAQAGILSMLDGTTTGTTYGNAGPYTSPASYTCTSSDTKTACRYASLNGFTPGASGDSVTITFGDSTSSSAPSVSLSSKSTTPVSWMTATVSRNVSTFLMRLIGPTVTTVTASGTAAIVDAKSTLPIVVLHRTLAGAFSKNGSNDVIICGGPSQSIQVDSTDTGAVSVSGNSGHIDLTHAGPLDSGNCTTGTGADFDSSGGPTSNPTGLELGSLPGEYISGASPIDDPFINMPAPLQPGTGYTHSDSIIGPCSTYPSKTCTLSPGVGDCPSDLTTHTSQTSCTMYSPGYYDNGISPSGGFVIFRPGVYYINHNGFQLGSNTIARMAITSPYNLDPNSGDSAYTGWTQGMLIYNSPQSPVKSSKDILSIAANSGQINNYVFPNAAACGTDVVTGSALGGNCLVGANGGTIPSVSGACPTTATLNAMFYGALFFQDRTVGTNLTHSFSGGGGLTLIGTIYASSLTGGSYQTVSLQGNGGSTTTLQGQIIVDALSLGGTSAIAMNLSGLPCYTVRRVALVQ
jgi:hypothetical protein